MRKVPERVTGGYSTIVALSESVRPHSTDGVPIYMALRAEVQSAVYRLGLISEEISSITVQEVEVPDDTPRMAVVVVRYIDGKNTSEVCFGDCLDEDATAPLVQQQQRATMLREILGLTSSQFLLGSRNGTNHNSHD